MILKSSRFDGGDRAEGRTRGNLLLLVGDKGLVLNSAKLRQGNPKINGKVAVTRV